jgi:hypothetical protein
VGHFVEAEAGTRQGSNLQPYDPKSTMWNSIHDSIEAMTRPGQTGLVVGTSRKANDLSKVSKYTKLVFSTSRVSPLCASGLPHVDSNHEKMIQSHVVPGWYWSDTLSLMSIAVNS